VFYLGDTETKIGLRQLHLCTRKPRVINKNTDQVINK